NIIGQRIAIVDPETRRRLEADHIGEVWVGGPHICKGYWSHPATTRSTFRARIEGEDEFWLRTGDLGFIDEAGELFISGRIKDVIIVRGINYYPQDIENTVYDSHPSLRRYCGAVFSVLTENTEEKVVLVQEVERVHRRDLEIDEIIGCIREAVVNEQKSHSTRSCSFALAPFRRQLVARFSAASPGGCGCRIHSRRSTCCRHDV